MPLNVEIREEREGDAPGIRNVEQRAFGEEDEAKIVDMLRASDSVVLSLVAVDGGEVVGHVLFSPVTVESSPEDARWAALGPIGVLPDRQGGGIGSRLVREGLDLCRSRGWDGVVLLGDPGYYGRFGFVPAGDHGLTDPYGGGPAFQAIELRQGALERVAGAVRFAPEFDQFAPGEEPE
ncbi:MAG: N-acetyltransferase [Chloroflexota bacterium]|nr:N-acetyltransferase [Chloroflexota bacterium]MDE2886126.1 N-acetyltransferase [Chloroflexota bacterium]